VAEFNAGTIKSTADIDIQPFKRGLDKIEKRGEKFDRTTYKAKAEVDTDPADRALDRLEGRLSKLQGGALRIDADTTAAGERIKALGEQADRLTRGAYAMQFSADTLHARQQIEQLEQTAARLGTAHVRVDADTAAAKASLDALKTQIDGMVGGKVRVDADTTAARMQLTVLEAQLTRLTGRTWSVKVDLDGFAGAMMQLNALGAMLQRLGAYTPTIRPDVDTGRASTEIRALRAQLAALSQQNANARVGISGGGQAQMILAAIVAGLGAIGYAAPAAAAALAAIPAALTGAGQMIGALAGGLSGIGDAYTAMGEADTASAGASSAAGRQREAAAQQVQSATRGLAQAHEQASRAAIQSEWAVADAARAVADARVQADQRVTQAARALADAREAGARRVADADRTAAQAAQALQRAQEQLTDAWRQGREELEDLQLSLRGGALSQERAAIQLQRAQQRLQQGIAEGVGGLDRQELELDVREAQFQLDSTAERMGDLREQQAVFNREGIAGSQAVKSARAQVTAAEQAYADAVRARGQAARDADKQVQAAAEQLRDAQVEGRRQVADAERQYSRAVLQARWQQQDAAAAVTAAEEQLAQAIKGMGDAAAGGAGKVDKLAEAMAKLTPEGRAFVRFLHDEWSPAWKAAMAPVQAELLPKLTDGMRRLMGIAPTVSAGLQGTANVLGTLAIEAGKVTEQPWFRRDLATLMESNNRALWSFGQAGLSSAESMVTLGAAAAPIVEHFSRMVQYGAQAFETWLVGKSASGELTAELWAMSDRLGEVWQFLKDVTAGVWGLAQGLAPLGSFLMGVIGPMARWIGDMAEAHPILTSIAGGAVIAAAALWKLGGAFAAMKASAAIGGIVAMAGGLRTLLTPSLAMASGPAVRASTAIAGFGQKLGMSAGSAVVMGARVMALASYLPLAAAAAAAAYIVFSELTTSTDEAADAMEKGGAASAELIGKLQEQSAQQVVGPSWINDLNSWFRSELGIVETVDEARAALEAKRAKMTELERAQSYATEAQGNYELAVRQFGPASQPAQAALTALRNRSRDLEISQLAARQGVDKATAAIIYQRDTVLGTLDADLRKRQATQELARSQEAYATAVRDHGPASREAIDAGLQLESTQLQVANAAKEGKDGMSGYGRAIGDMVAQTKGELSPTLVGAVQAMDATALSAAGARLEFDNAGRAVARFPNGKTVVLDANTSPALMGLNGVIAKLGTVPDHKPINVGVISIPAQQALQSIGLQVNTLPDGTVEVTANDAQARATLLAFQWYADAVRTNPAIAANPQLAYDTMHGFINKANAQVGVPGLSTNPAEANRIVDERLRTFNNSWSALPVDAWTRPATDSANAAKDGIDNPVTMPVGANYDDARRESDNFFGWLWGEVKRLGSELGSSFSKGPPVGKLFGAGAVVAPQAAGSVLFNAPGRSLTPMPGGTAQTVPPNTWRVVGDRMDVAESYIPHDKSTRSRAILADTARAMGYAVVPRDAVAMAAGGTLNRAPAGGGATGGPEGAPAAAPAAAAPAAAPAVGVDAGQQAAAASGMAQVTTAAQTQAATILGQLVPALQAQQLATENTRLSQQSLVSAGITPLVAAVVGTLAPALGVTAPAAHTALQTAETATRLSTTATGLNTATNSTQMAAAMTTMALVGQQQHGMLRYGQLLTRVSSDQTRFNTQANNAAMVLSTTGASLQQQYQHSMLRYGQGLTQQSTGLTAAITAARNNEMVGSTGYMSGTNQMHLANLRGAQGVTAGATTAFADAFRAQMGRTVPDSANPIRWVIDFPIRSITDAWNNLDRQFALGKQVPPYRAAFASGGITGVRPGYSPGRDTHQIAVGGGESIMRPEWTQAVGPAYVHQANAAARRGGQAGVAQFLSTTGSTSPRIEGAKKLQLMRRYPLDNGVTGHFAYGGVAPHVAAAGDEITRVFGRMPGGIGGRAPRGNASDHPSGFALDFMTMGNMGLGDRVNGYLNANRGRMQVKYLIWKQRIDGRPMEDRGSPTANHMDHVHASFRGGPGGDGGGGGFFDPTPIVDAAFAKAYREIADVPKFFGPSDQVARDQGIARQGADRVRQTALDKIMATMGSGMVDVSGISGPVVEQVRQVAARYGWNVGPNWDQGIFPLVAKESGWNPAAANPTSSARGLFQKMTSIHGPVEPTPAGQAAWGLNYIRGRYGTPSAAWAFHRSHNYYDQGGVASEPGALPKATPEPERVLSPRQTEAFDDLVAGALSSVRATGSVQMLTSDALEQLRAAGDGGAADEIAALRGELGQALDRLAEIAARSGHTFHVHGGEATNADDVADRVAARQSFALQLQG
jgi:hypothetical protein